MGCFFISLSLVVDFIVWYKNWRYIRPFLLFWCHGKEILSLSTSADLVYPSNLVTEGCLVTEKAFGIKNKDLI